MTIREMTDEQLMKVAQGWNNPRKTLIFVLMCTMLFGAIMAHMISPPKQSVYSEQASGLVSSKVSAQY